MDVGLPEILVIIVIIVLLFGPGRIQKIFSEMGKGIKSFRDGIQGKENQPGEEEQKKETPKEDKKE
jgi:sec-independent protein translocase protein TatA